MTRKYIWIGAGALGVLVTAGAGLIWFGISSKEPAATNGPKRSAQQTPQNSPAPSASSSASRSPQKGQSAGTTTAAPVPPPDVPARTLNLTDWKLTLPVDTARPGSPDEITQPALASFALAPYFALTPSKDGVTFRAPVGGHTTNNSGYPRSELREMTSGGSRRASWSNSTGSHTLTIRQAITHLPAVKPEVVAGQIHDDSDDVIMIRLERNRLFVESGGKNIGDLDTAYSLGRVFTVQIVAEAGRIKVSYNDVPKVDYIRSGSGYYFKAGCYTQSNPSKGDKPDDYGEVVIYGVHIRHN